MSNIKPIKVDLPYPSFEDICQDVKSGVIIAPAYASLESELAAILQYIYHAFYFDWLEEGETASLLRAIAVTEMHHLDILGELLLRLGIDPVYTANPPCKCNFFNTSAISYSKTPQKMLIDDIRGEIGAVNMYEAMLSKLENECVAAVIARIKLDEELHIKVLRERLEKYSECK